MNNTTNGLERAVFGNGCFWCTEAIFFQLKGVEKVTSGYSGGKNANPTYKEVCGGYTGHAECLEIWYNPQVISFKELLEVFFITHDPTTLNRQGNDIGTQYRSVIFYINEAQKKESEEIIQTLTLQKAFNSPIVTQLDKLSEFYPAEDYHQQYFALNGSQPYCNAVIKPKVDKFRKKFAHKLK